MPTGTLIVYNRIDVEIARKYYRSKADREKCQRHFKAMYGKNISWGIMPQVGVREIEKITKKWGI